MGQLWNKLDFFQSEGAEAEALEDMEGTDSDGDGAEKEENLFSAIKHSMNCAIKHSMNCSLLLPWCVLKINAAS